MSLDETVSGPKYSGFCIDMLEFISKKLKFRYEIYLVPDSNYGIEEHGTWNGMVGEVYYGVSEFCKFINTLSASLCSNVFIGQIKT